MPLRPSVHLVPADCLNRLATALELERGWLRVMQVPLQSRFPRFG